MTGLKNLVAMAAFLVIPVVLYLGWNKYYIAAWLLMIAYAATLGYLYFADRRQH